MVPVFVLVLMGTVGFAGPAHGQEAATPGTGLVADSDTLIVVDPVAGSLSATHVYEFTNPTDDEVFGSFFETVPASAIDIIASAGGLELLVLRGSEHDGTVEILIGFPAELEPGDQTAVELTWTSENLDGDPNQLDHASPALVAIDAFAVGHGGGAASLTVEVPSGYAVVEQSGLDASEIDGRMVLRSTVAVPYISRPVVLTSPARLTRARIRGIELDITLASLPGSDGELRAQIRELVPILSTWLPIEAPGPIEFRHGWTGSSDVLRIDSVDFDADGTSAPVIVVSPEVQLSVVGREIANEWLARLAFDDPRMRTALASVFGSAAAFAPSEATDDENPWVSPFAAVFAEFDDEITATVVSLLGDGSLAYPGRSPISRDAPLDWRVVLDALENVGGSERAADLFRPVVDADAELDQRSDARIDYLDVAARADDWSLPPWLRVAMAEWDFDAFESRRLEVEELIDSRDELRIQATEIDLSIGSFVGDIFEAADDGMEEAAVLLAQQREALELVAEARQLTLGDRGLLSRIGLAGVDTRSQYEDISATWDAGEFAAASRDAHDLIERMDAAVAKGTLRLVVPSVAVVALLALLRWALKRRTPTVEDSPVQVDSVQVDSVQVDSVQVDSVQVDSVQVDSVQVDSVQVDSA